MSEVCRRHQLAPGVFCGWERLAKQGALDALRGKRAQDPDATTAKLRASPLAPPAQPEAPVRGQHRWA